jgi:hypothetical protein
VKIEAGLAESEAVIELAELYSLVVSARVRKPWRISENNWKKKAEENPMAIDTSNFTAAEAARELGWTVESINEMLERKGYQRWDGRKWILTEKGRAEAPGLRTLKVRNHLNRPVPIVGRGKGKKKRWLGANGHWYADEWYRSRARDANWLRTKYQLNPEMNYDEFEDSCARAEEEAAEQGIILHEVDRFFCELINWHFREEG